MAKKTVRDRFGKVHRLPIPITRDWVFEMASAMVAASGKSQAEIARELQLKESNVSGALRNPDPRYEYLRLRIIRDVGGIPVERVRVYRIGEPGSVPDDDER